MPSKHHHPLHIRTVSSSPSVMMTESTNSAADRTIPTTTGSGSAAVSSSSSSSSSYNHSNQHSSRCYGTNQSPSFEVSSTLASSNCCRQPRKLRKQINTKAFKENYFELDITSSSEVQLLQFKTDSSSNKKNKKESGSACVSSNLKRVLSNNNNNNNTNHSPPQKKSSSSSLNEPMKEVSNNKKKRKTMEEQDPIEPQQAPTTSSSFNTTTTMSGSLYYSPSTTTNTTNKKKMKRTTMSTRISSEATLSTSPPPSPPQHQQPQATNQDVMMVAHIQEKVEQVIQDTIPLIYYLNSLNQNPNSTSLNQQITTMSHPQQQQHPMSRSTIMNTTTICQEAPTMNQTSPPSFGVSLSHSNTPFAQSNNMANLALERYTFQTQDLDHESRQEETSWMVDSSFALQVQPPATQPPHGIISAGPNQSMNNSSNLITFNDTNFQELCKILTNMLESDPFALQKLQYNNHDMSQQNQQPLSTYAHHTHQHQLNHEHVSLPSQGGSQLQRLTSSSPPNSFVNVRHSSLLPVAAVGHPQEVPSSHSLLSTIGEDLNLNSLLMLNGLNNASRANETCEEESSSSTSSSLLNIPSNMMFFND
nr:unnamed protein product [Naegleria fowleri]